MNKSLLGAAAAVLAGVLSAQAQDKPCDAFLSHVVQKCAQEQPGQRVCMFPVKDADGYVRIEYDSATPSLVQGEEAYQSLELLLPAGYKLIDDHLDGVVDDRWYGIPNPPGTPASFNDKQHAYESTCRTLGSQF